MLFNLEEDHGSRLRLYLIPDAGGATPAIRLFSAGVELARISADTVRPEVVASGRHATGLCGFNITEEAVPGLAACADLELREAETGLLIYRRARPGFVPDLKVFRLETHLLPLRRFDEAVRDRFQVWHQGIDKQGIETAMQCFMLTNCASLYVSGRLQFQAVETHLRDFRSLILMRDPFRELAERLLMLRNLPEECGDLLGARDVLTFRIVVDYLRSFETLDHRFCKQLIRRAPESVLRVLSNPVMRQLSSRNPDEVPKKNAMSAALQALSGFDVVGVRDDAALFATLAQDCLEIDESLPVMAEHARVRELGDALRRFGKAESLIEYDLEVFDHVERAFASAQGATAPQG